jgi:hypothetical protein
MVSVRRISALGMLLAFSVLGLSSCLYDSSDRCDLGQAYDANAGLCVCTGNTIPGTTIEGAEGCVPCPEHEVARNDACACEEGYQRATPAGACTKPPEALGRACESDRDCTDPTYASCHLLADASGYCTNVGCAQGDCIAGYVCDTLATPPYCARPPDGAGKSCATSKDCAGTEATWCDSFETHLCYVEGCAVDGNDCPGKECCDLAVTTNGAFKKTICVDPGKCQGVD